MTRAWQVSQTVDSPPKKHPGWKDAYHDHGLGDHLRTHSEPELVLASSSEVREMKLEHGLE